MVVAGGELVAFMNPCPAHEDLSYKHYLMGRHGGILACTPTIHVKGVIVLWPCTLSTLFHSFIVDMVGF